jgi:small-conductance mechanosensitive channel
MSPFEQMRDAITAWIAGFDATSLLAQSVVMAFALAFGYLLKRGFSQRYPAGRLRGSRHVLQRSIEHLVYPLGTLVLIAAARPLLATAGMNVYLLDIALPVLVSLALIRVVVDLLRKAFVASPAIKAWEQALSFTVWGLVALHLVGWLRPLLDALDAVGMTLGSTRVTLLSVGKLALMIVVMIGLALWLSQLIERRVGRALHFSPSLRVAVAKFSKFFLLTLACLIALDSVGIDLGSLTVFGGALGVGIGFGLQRIASNFISGFILIADRSIKPGDVITIGTKFGWVEEMRARYIVVRNRDGEETLIPNENLITSEVINWSYSDPNVRLRIPVQISYADDPEQALKILLEAAANCPRVLQDPPPAARLMEFADSGISLDLRIWYNDPQNGTANIRSDVNLAIWRGFKAAGITIPFPQRDVHLHQAAAPAPSEVTPSASS